MVKFRVTQRCLREDLGLPEEYVNREAAHFAVEHEAVRVFVGKRSAAPAVGENLLDVQAYGHVKTLHVGKARGATIFDAEEQVCWLLAYGETHAVGERRDSYNEFVRLDRRGELMPTGEDYLALESITSASVIDAMREVAGRLVTTARADLGREKTETLSLSDDNGVEIAVCIEMLVVGPESAEQGWISFILPYDAPLTVENLLDFVVDLLPQGVALESVEQAGEVNGRPIHHNELAFTWSIYGN
ncbi:hypothetical protein [Micrococcus luteus]|uniref:hypothetical protein n=1 Tax=Micrococcus luteus TaxID=1270 RepID=UPI001AE6CC58|nr:hypothetical protein [Micrococcus luteus]QTP17465.1 hypothetical protein J7660_05610 [Micrococcus luteus]